MILREHETMRGFYWAKFTCELCGNEFIRVVRPDEEKRFCSQKCRVSITGYDKRYRLEDEIPQTVAKKLIQEYFVFGDDILDILEEGKKAVLGRAELPKVSNC